jgi:hypothetical protein
VSDTFIVPLVDDSVLRPSVIIVVRCETRFATRGGRENSFRLSTSVKRCRRGGAAEHPEILSGVENCATRARTEAVLQYGMVLVKSVFLFDLKCVHFDIKSFRKGLLNCS